MMAMLTLRTTPADESGKGIVADPEISRTVAQVVESEEGAYGAELRCQGGYLGVAYPGYVTWLRVGGSEE